MGLISDIFLVAAALGATFYCFVLSRRLSKFTDLENGVGGAIAALSAQVEDMTRTLRSAQGAASASASSLGALTGRAEDAARRLELLVASMHDLPPMPDASRSAADMARTQAPAAVRTTIPTQAQAPVETDRTEEGAGPTLPAFTSRRAASEAAE